MVVDRGANKFVVLVFDNIYLTVASIFIVASTNRHNGVDVKCWVGVFLALVFADNPFPMINILIGDIGIIIAFFAAFANMGVALFAPNGPVFFLT